MGKFDHTSHCFFLFNALKIEKLYEFRLAILTYKLIVTKMSSYFLDIINSYTNTSRQNLRKINLYYVPKCRTKIQSNSTLISFLKIWNSIPDNLRSVSSLGQFKRLILNYIIQDNLTLT